MSPAERGASQAQAIAAESRRDAATLTASLMADVEAGIRVLRTRDGVPLTDAQVRDRAANICSGLLGNYRIEPLTGVRYTTAFERIERGNARALAENLYERISPEVGQRLVDSVRNEREAEDMEAHARRIIR